MSRIYDLTEESLKRLRNLVSDPSIQEAAESALSDPARHCRNGVSRVHRLRLTDAQRDDVLAQLKRMLARHGYEERGGEMLPIGHVYEGLIQTFSQPSRCVA